MDTESKIPVPEPITPTKSENIEIKPIIIPPHAAATGIYRFNTISVWLYWYPLITIDSSLSFLATSRGDYFETSNQNLNIDHIYLEKNAQHTITNVV